MSNKYKYTKAPKLYRDMKFKNHWLIGTIWPYVNRFGDVHETELTAKGFTCTCMGFNRWGKCKHIARVHGKLVA